ncbi:MAG: PfkB family carbohydrate kinase [Pseudomonadota bacterium]
MTPEPTRGAEAAPPVLCVGAVVRDTLARSSTTLAVADDVPGRVLTRIGGVAANVACALTRLGHGAALLGALGDDAVAQALLAELGDAGVSCGPLGRYPGPTDQVVTLENPDGERFAAVADCRQWDTVSRSKLGALCAVVRGWAGDVVIDGNACAESLAALVASATGRVTLVPASEAKADRLRPLLTAHGPAVVVNRREAERIAARSVASSEAAARALRDLGAREAAVTDGDRTAALATPKGVAERHPRLVTVVSTTGAGDAFAAGVIAQGTDDADARLARALDAAASHLESASV